MFKSLLYSCVFFLGAHAYAGSCSTIVKCENPAQKINLHFYGMEESFDVDVKFGSHRYTSSQEQGLFTWATEMVEEKVFTLQSSRKEGFAYFVGLPRTFKADKNTEPGDLSGTFKALLTAGVSTPETMIEKVPVSCTYVVSGCHRTK